MEWNLYLARYQKARGGDYFCGDGWGSDAQLGLPQEGKHPLLVLFYEANAGRSSYAALKGRTLVRLERDYDLHIRAKSLVGSGVSGVAGLVGKEMTFGYPEALKGRIVTTSDSPFTKLVLGDRRLRDSLTQRKKEYLRVFPAPLGEGWHAVEVGVADLQGGVMGRDSSWVSEDMAQGETAFNETEKQSLEENGQIWFNAQMDDFLGFLRAARDAVTAWPMPVKMP